MKSSHQKLSVLNRHVRTRIERCVQHVSNQTLTGLTEPDSFGFLKPNHVKNRPQVYNHLVSGQETKATTHTKYSYTHETPPAVQPNEIKIKHEPTITLR